MQHNRKSTENESAKIKAMSENATLDLNQSYENKAIKQCKWYDKR
jgi:hypothetical protein